MRLFILRGNGRTEKLNTEITEHDAVMQCVCGSSERSWEKSCICRHAKMMEGTENYKSVCLLATQVISHSELDFTLQKPKETGTACIHDKEKDLYQNKMPAQKH